MGIFFLLVACVESQGQTGPCLSMVDNATVVIPDSASVEGAPFFEADSVAVFAGEETCVGAGRWRDSNSVAIAVAGRGPFEDGGLGEKEPFHFRLYDARGGQRRGGSGMFVECERLRPRIQIFCRDDGRYEDDTIYVLRSIRAGPSSADEDDVRDLELSAPYPNPTRGQVKIPFATPERQRVSLKLYDALGRVAQTLGQGRVEGRQMMQVNLSGLASGTYFLQLRSEGETRTQRITVVR